MAKTPQRRKPLLIAIPTKLEKAGELEKKVSGILKKIEKKAADVKKRQDELKELETEAAQYCIAIKAFAEANPHPKMKHIPKVGDFGYRNSHRVVTKDDVKKIIATIEEKGHKNILVRYPDPEIDKAACKQHPDIVATIPGLGIENVQVFVVKPADRQDKMEYDPIEQRWSYQVQQKRTVQNTPATQPHQEAAE
jgi:phage host-nuclease inhibitor protein Gam